MVRNSSFCFEFIFISFVKIISRYYSALCSYKEAEEILCATYDMVKKMAEDNDESISTRWEPLLNNLGHACRKNKKYDEALSYHTQVDHFRSGWMKIKLIDILLLAGIGFETAECTNLYLYWICICFER